MALSTETIGALFVGVSGVMTAAGALLAGRAKKITTDSRELRRLRQKELLKNRYIHRLEVKLANADIPLPDKPEKLEEMEKEDEEAEAKL